jgi:type II secretory pathway pseudopilin PulG
MYNLLLPDMLKAEINKQEGYSLIELIVTIIFIGIVFPGLIGFFTNIMDDSVRSESMSQAIALAQQQMEEISADKNEITRGLNYIKTPGQYGPTVVGLHTCSVSVSDTIIGSVAAVQVMVTVTHPLLNENYNLQHLFTEFTAY